MRKAGKRHMGKKNREEAYRQGRQGRGIWGSKTGKRRMGEKDREEAYRRERQGRGI